MTFNSQIQPEDRSKNLTSFEQVIEEWQTKLLQMNRRNRLLYFQGERGRSNVHIDKHSPDSLFEELQSAFVGLTFDYAEARPKSEDDEEPEPYLLPGDIETTHDPVDLQRRLRLLKNRAREWEEEQGIPILFLAIGLLRWVDEDYDPTFTKDNKDIPATDRQPLAPLLLLSCNLEQASSRDKFTLRIDGEDPVVNQTLRVKFNKDFNLDLPEFNPTDDEDTLNNYLNTVRQLVKDRPDWEVLDDIYLSTFSTSKLAMWHDLETLKKQGPRHEIIQGLTGNTPSFSKDDPPSAFPTIPPEEELKGGRLDEILPARNDFTILPADYSQLITITKARSGRNLIVHGPPGTGKSQTIANIITASMADGKSVLFVSEKQAALDVVKKRLVGKGLGSMILDMHKEGSKKRNVYDQFKESLEDDRKADTSEFEYAMLEEYRQQLNGVVQALHQLRQPLGQTVFQIQGRLASRKDVASLDFEVEHIEDLDENRLATIRAACNRIELRPQEFKEHGTSDWRVLKAQTPSLELANDIRRDMQALIDSIQDIKSAASIEADTLGLPNPSNLIEVINLEGIARHLVTGSGIPASWLEAKVSSNLRAIALKESELQSERARLTRELTNAFGHSIPDLDFATLQTELTLSTEEQDDNPFLGDQWKKKVVARETRTSEDLKLLDNLVGRIQTNQKDIKDLLRTNPVSNWQDLETIAGVSETITRIGPVPSGWVKPKATKDLYNRVNNAKHLDKELTELEKKVFDVFDPGVTKVTDSGMLRRFRTDHQSAIKRFFGKTYRSDRKALQSYRHKAGQPTLQDEARHVAEIEELKQSQQQFKNISENLQHDLGDRYKNRDTEWDSIAKDLQDVGTLLEQDLHESLALDRLQIAAILTDEGNSSECRELVETLRSLQSQAEHLVTGSDFIELTNLVQVPYSSITQQLQSAVLTSERIEAAVAILRGQLDPGHVLVLPNLGDVQDLIAVRLRLLDLDNDHSRAVEKGKYTDLAGRFEGFDTNWEEVLQCLTWAEELIPLVGALPITSDLQSHVENPHPPSDYTKIADLLHQQITQFKTRCDLTNENYDLAMGLANSSQLPNSLTTLKTHDVEFTAGITSWKGISTWATKLRDDADKAGGWLDYQSAIKQFASVMGASTLEQIREITDESALVVKIAERRIFTKWLDWVFELDPILGKFSVVDQQDLTVKFKQLDSKLATAAKNEVRRKVLEGYPTRGDTSVRGGALGIMQAEVQKKKRLKPVRELFQHASNLAKKLKPCFLMSPLTVSQYLPLAEDPSETMTFDVVIFDEASQVFPHEAVPAILHAKQLILAGDQQQLPPSNFYDTNIDDNDLSELGSDDGSDPNLLAGMESILDAAKGIGGFFDDAHLRVHYRSLDESLIAFSNHYYYENKLLTFPSPRAGKSWNGVHDVYLPDGRYEAGTSRTNRLEAEKVVELVFDHFRTRPVGETLGVAAMSRPQADLIETLIQEKRVIDRAVDTRFDENPEEPFFVKNLERVQGDERDRIIISIGYGPTKESGEVPNRFGPINATGGQRRLNVLVTRARKRVDLVHSLRASDIRSDQVGARMLRNYIEYAENPDKAFEGRVSVNPAADYESPFEEAVGQALIARGHKIALQVGVSGYRIDLSILSDDGTAHDLGIECDGETHHGAPAARDRDRLRQDHLEGLGWRIHRIWSTAWVRDPKTEIEKVENALAKARGRSDSYDDQPERVPQWEKSGSSDVTPPPNGPPSLGSDDSLEEVRPSAPSVPNLEPYKPVSSDSLQKVRDKFTRHSSGQLQGELPENLVALITEIARVEGPVHKQTVINRLREHYGVGSVKGPTLRSVEEQIDRAQTNGQVKGDRKVKGARCSDFIWVSEDQRRRVTKAPRESGERKIAEIHQDELSAITIAIAESQFGVPLDDLITAVARTLGFNRTGSAITDRLRIVLKNLIREGVLIEELGKIQVRAFNQ